MNLLSRRLFLSLLPAAFRQPCVAAPRAAAGVQQYQANAVVLLLGMPVYRRKDVGGAWLRVKESAGAAYEEVTLQFAAGSIPARAAGLNRLGYIEEEVRIHASGKRVVKYFGVMTASKEESFEEARKALSKEGSGQQVFVAMRGEVDKSTVRNCTAKVAFDQPLGWPHVDQLTGKCRESLASMRTSEIAANSPMTFLHALYQTMRGEGEEPALFLHSGKPYLLRTRVRKDGKAGQDFQQRGMVTSADAVNTLDGHIHAATADGKPGAQTASFQVWYAREGSETRTLRFDLKPRSFLRLSFELRG